jgi:aspartate aminotransferase
MSPRVSERAQRLPASPIRRLAPAADAARKRGTHVYHLNIGQPDIETPECFRERLSRIEERVLAYSPSEGIPELVTVMRGYYAGCGIDLEDEQILITTGGSEACLFAFLACAGEGDDALVMEPYYTNYNAFATMGGVRLVPLTTSGDDGFHAPPLEAWEKALTPRTRMVVICNPSNPTGTVYSREELLGIASFCREHGLFLVSDEVYREFVYDGRKAISALELEGFEDLVVVADSLSKRYSACGIRLGTLATRNDELREACLRMAQGRLCAPGIAQKIALGAAELGEAFFGGIVAEYQQRRDVLFEGLRALPGVFLRRPEGAFYLMPRLPIDDADRFAEWLLAEFQLDGATLMVAPAPGFYVTPGLGRDEVRMAYVLNGDDLRAAVRCLGAALERYPGRRERSAAS